MPPDGSAYQFNVPEDATAVRFTVPSPHLEADTLLTIVGIAFTVASTAVLEAVVHPLLVAFT